MLEDYFKPFRERIIGYDQTFHTPFGEQKIIYADWTASGRLYGPIEERLQQEIAPFVGNTHTETTITGCLMTRAYKEARKIIKKHVNASEKDVLIFFGSGMTGAVNKLQRILGFKVPEQALRYLDFNGNDKISLAHHLRPEKDRPVVFITHMEHHSNHTSWLETVADVVIINPDNDGLCDLQHFETLLDQYQDRKLKIAAITACSNVTGLQPPYHKMAKMIHAAGGYCFVDFACSAPYVDIDMHPEDPEAHLDAIYFSPHKFLGGPGTSGVLIFNQKLYKNRIPDQPGGGTVLYTNPWKFHEYLEDIEEREDGGTPPFMQGIKIAMAVKLKEEMGVDNMLAREKEILKQLFDGLKKMDQIKIMAGQHESRLGVIAFYVEGLHYNLITRLLNDRYGIQVRGGCACAGTYGHYLLHIDELTSYQIYHELNTGNNSVKPGWVRLSIHPVMSDQEIRTILDALQQILDNASTWAKDYTYDPKLNEYIHYNYQPSQEGEIVEKWLNAAFV